ncbi:MAG TPA: hypothetical protein PKN92_01280 [Candidatus Hydrogenedentes bacterium]|nr:hypothetical protein [Candidatus Hydrogenedentota bacterium]HOD94681.1 hypothetical protein [Candidatus Hydrogenedentota bacterium]
MLDFIKKYQTALMAGVLLFSLGAGVLLNNQLRHLRESEAFYRWLLAAAVNERLFQENEDPSEDALFFARCTALAEKFPSFSPSDKVDGLSMIGSIAKNYENDKRLWFFAESDLAKEERAEFLQLAKKQKLQFATDIEYAEAQAGGVNVFNLFFGFRKVAANLVWLEVDRYWHQGNVYRMQTLMRTCVALDPQFVEAYLVGAWHLSYNATAQMQDTPWPQREWNAKYGQCLGEKERFYYYGVDFLREGIRRNPRNYKLYFDLGFGIYKQKLEDYPNAVKYLSEAIRLPHDRWVPRQLFLCQELNGQYGDALEGWKDYVERYPGSMTAVEVAPRFIMRNEGMLYEKEARTLRKKAKESSDPAEAEELRAQAENYWKKARDTWNALDDPYGEGRKLMMDALDLREEGRYLEAIATLDKARWDTGALFEEFSSLIMEIKLEAHIPLSVSEKKALLRESEVGLCSGMPDEERQRRLKSAESIESTFQ